jgi:hypothetical protein
MTIRLAVPVSHAAAVRSGIYAFASSREDDADERDCGIFITVHSEDDICHYDLDFADTVESDAFLSFFSSFAPMNAHGCAITTC